MASLVLSGDTSGSITVSAPAVAGSNTQTLVATTGTLAPIVSGTAVASTSGTSIDFTGIPSWVKRITVMFSGLSTNGSSIVQIQLGTSSGVVTSGYLGSVNSGSTTGVAGATFTTGLGLTRSGVAGATAVLNGNAQFTLLGSNIWTGNTVNANSDTGVVSFCATSISLGGTLDRVRITTVNGTDTFDAGTINLMWE